MNKRAVCCLSILILVLVNVETGWAQGVITLPQTGQATCYDESGTVISCAGTGQDGEIQAGAKWPDPRFTVSGDCVTDKLTGLMWAKNGNPVGYGIWQWALDYVASVNSGAGLCGYSDWRLSNINEQESLANAEEADTATWLNGQGFSSVQPFNHWSSTTYAGDSSKAWSVYMQDGNVDPYGQGYYHFVWPVRSGQLNNPDPLYPANVWKTGQASSYAIGDDGNLERGVSWPTPRFTDPGDGTVTDTLTGLMWTKETNLSSGTRTWQGALDDVAAINSGAGLGGYHDWRLPNRKELFSLIDYSRYYPTLRVGHPFQNVQPDAYWSSTTYAYRSYAAWSVSMLNGAVNDDDKSVGHFVWPVRSGYIPPKNPDISITPNPLPFGAVIVGSSSDQSITVKNDGTANLVIGSITTPDSPFSKGLDNCSGQTVPPNGTCTVTSRFSPTAGGSVSRSSNIPSNDPDEASVVIELKGTGVNFTVSPSEGTLGTTMVLEGPGFGSKKGKVLVGGLAAKVTEWIPGRISLTLSKVPASAGTYPVVIQPKDPKGAEAITELEGFTLKGPEIEDLSANHGGLGQVITINGKFFGSKKGKVYLGGKSCKVTSWIVNQAGGNDEIKFQVPKGVTGTQELHVSNRVGSSGTVGFTVD
jgi:hypothetical protein